MPASVGKNDWEAWVSCRARAVRKASCSACGWMLKTRGFLGERIHVGRAGHVRQGARSKRMTTTGWPCRLGVVVHLTLVCPCGQRAVQVCQSKTKSVVA